MLKVNFLNNYSTHSNNVFDNGTAFSEQKFINASSIPQFLLISQPQFSTTTHQIISFNSNKIENDKNTNDYMSLHASIVEFVNRFRFVNIFYYLKLNKFK